MAPVWHQAPGTPHAHATTSRPCGQWDDRQRNYHESSVAQVTLTRGQNCHVTRGQVNWLSQGHDQIGTVGARRGETTTPTACWVDRRWKDKIITANRRCEQLLARWRRGAARPGTTGRQGTLIKAGSGTTTEWRARPTGSTLNCLWGGSRETTERAGTTTKAWFGGGNLLITPLAGDSTQWPRTVKRTNKSSLITQ